MCCDNTPISPALGRLLQLVRRRLRLRLSTLLVVMLTCSVVFGMLAVRLCAKRSEERTVRYILAAGGTVYYNYQWKPGMSYANEAAEPPGPRWLRCVLGDDFFSSVVLVQMAQATDNDLVDIGRLKGLQFLDLSHSSEITDEGFLHLTGLHDVEELYLWDSGINDRGLASIRDLDNLALLVLDDTSITDRGLEYVRNLTRLSYLSLLGTHITDAGVMTLGEMDSLEDLRLAFNNLTDACLVHLQSMHNLKRLSLPANKSITESAIRRLRVDLPNTEIDLVPNDLAK